MSYCWGIDGKEENLNGPFETLEECEENCADSVSYEEQIIIYTVKDICPQDWSNGIIDTDDILDKIENSLFFNIEFKDTVFSIDKTLQTKAQEELNAVINEWVAKHVNTNGEWDVREEFSRTTGKELKHKILKRELVF